MTSVLNEWRKGEGVKTWRVIYDAAKKLNNSALAEKIQQLHDLDSTGNTHHTQTLPCVWKLYIHTYLS